MVAQQHPGHIYLIHAQGTDRYKIGLVKSPRTPQDRIKELNSKQSAFPLELIYSIETNDTFGTEKALHRHYDKQRVHGEWFKFDSIDDVVSNMSHLEVKPYRPRETYTPSYSGNGFDLWHWIKVIVGILLLLGIIQNNTGSQEYRDCLEGGGGKACQELKHK
jgi:hypothetical protein